MRYFPDPDKNLDLGAVNRVVEAAFADHGKGLVQMPPKIYVTLPAGDFRTMPGFLPTLGIAGVKIVNVHPDNPKMGLPTVMALTIILDIATGKPAAILNATRLTDLRTGAAGAIAAKYLAPKKECVLGVIGTGRQAEAQVRATAQEISLTGIRVWNRNSVHASAFAARLSPLSAESVSLEQACDCDVLVTTTPSRVPLIKSEWIHPGTHINAIGADAPGKEELDPEILHRARVFVDDPAQAFHSGEINVPISTGNYQPWMIAGTLGEVVIGKKKRENPDEITIFDSTGLAIQDLAIASLAMRQAPGMELPFL
ncbi:ornithine cyclodeaminase family protein [Methanoregula sp.]|uniref:ornithine cyclodeaminase family protein n=1 Tax=Methanoregula sp. TaxID=2052170 RepID=UPI002B8852D0|nr:ornithine cyclodeaminase family protein [Methanoregula sp.]HVP97281.1 ornithine cyclodeaminase family protein [Methanoregula sp.]